MLDCALDFFLERGFELTTTADIANEVGMSKRTLYVYYKDKGELFKAAVRRAAERYTVPREAFEAVATDDLRDTLMAVARVRIRNVATPNGVKLQRILNAQSYRFPELLREVFEQTTTPAVDFLAEVFSHRQASGEIDVVDPRRAAVAFLSLVLGGPTRVIIAGNPMSDEELEEHIRFTVGIFLNGVRRSEAR